jgi:hypothetical protein
LGSRREPNPAAASPPEIIPHFRPTGWTDAALNGLNGHPVRLTGQLFFDASHKPCTPGKKAGPPPVSLWEIHLIYAVDVCSNKTLIACDRTDESIWTPLEVPTSARLMNPGASRAIPIYPPPKGTTTFYRG